MNKTIDDDFQRHIAKQIFESTAEACTAHSDFYMAYQHHSSFATVLAANLVSVNCNSCQRSFSSFCALPCCSIGIWADTLFCDRLWMNFEQQGHTSEHFKSLELGSRRSLELAACTPSRGSLRCDSSNNRRWSIGPKMIYWTSEAARGTGPGIVTPLPFTITKLGSWKDFQVQFR